MNGTAGWAAVLLPLGPGGPVLSRLADEPALARPPVRGRGRDGPATGGDELRWRGRPRISDCSLTLVGGMIDWSLALVAG